MLSIAGPLKGATAVSAIVIALCLIANSAAAAEPKKTLRDGKLTDAEYSSSKKAKPRQVRVVVKQLVVHPPVVTRQSRSGRK